MRNSPHRLSTAALALTVAAPAVWGVFLESGGTLRVGRAGILLTGGLLLFEVLRTRRAPPRPTGAALATSAAFLALGLLILVSMRGQGCNCTGAIYSYAELTGVGLLATALLTLEPRALRPLLYAAVAGAALAGSLALAGVEELSVLNENDSALAGRLAGTFGNSNELGYLMALGLAATAGLAPRLPRRPAAAAGLALLVALMGAALLLSFSRGGVAAAGAGVFAVVLLRARSRRVRLRVLAAGAAAGLAAVALYPVFNSLRNDVSFAEAPPAAASIELRGWDGTALTLPGGFSRIRNPPGRETLEVRPNRSGAGVSRRFGRAHGGHEYVLRLEARALGAEVLPLALGLRGSAGAADGATAYALAGQRWRKLSLRWRPRLDRRRGRVLVWQNGGERPFELRRVTVSESEPGGPTRTLEVPVRREQTLAERARTAPGREQRRYIDSRLDGARAGIEAFRDQPLRGIGWDRFQDYARAELRDERLLATHNEYVRVAAELGVLGLLLAALVLAAALISVPRAARSGAAGLAAVGALVAGGVAQLFVNGITFEAASVPLALAIAAVVTARDSDARDQPRTG